MAYNTRPALLPDRPLRVALVGAGHWHAPYYAEALRKSGSELVGLTDADPATAARRGQELQIKTYDGAATVIEETRPDLIYAFAPHRDMTALVQELLDLGAPFVIEKPTGLDWRPLAAAAAKARELGAWAGVDLVARTHQLVARLRALGESGALGRVHNFFYRLFAGDPQRYVAWGVPWMLEPERAGAGCLYNFGPHVVDAFQWLTREPVIEVRCHLRHLHGLKIADYAHLTCLTPSGAVGNLEVGYICPGDFYERGLTLASDRLYVSSPNLDAGTLRWRDGRSEEVSAGDSGGDFWLAYVRDVERRLRAGEPPIATLDDMARTLRVLNAAEESARSGRPVRLE
ncbi:MAG: Gfo/Idh/MocA family oxidoreductase [Anaerolineae bacterium]|nr:Gfo/Idh/MocA family oxidoreductase [Anaerolineae bacterium]